MKRFLLLICAIISITATAQNQNEIISPEIASGNTVTFRLKAPDAKSVKISGNFTNPEWAAVDLVKDSSGIWSFTSSTLAPEMYSYQFIVDGVMAHDPKNLNLLRDAMNVFNYFIVPGGRADLYKVNDVLHGTVAFRWYDSPVIGGQRRMSVYTPPGYEQGKENYPVLYLMHGVGGDEEAWLELGRAAEILDNLIAKKEAKPMVVVMTNGHANHAAVPAKSPVSYMPQFGGPDVFNGQFEESFRDIMKFAESNYRIKKEKQSRAIAGLSMGGFHTLYISANYANTFDYMGLFSAATVEPKNPDSTIYKNLDDKLTLQKQNGYKVYWMGMGKTDFLYTPFTDFRKKLDAMEFKYTYRESEGGHNWANWRMYLTEFVPLLFK